MVLDTSKLVKELRIKTKGKKIFSCNSHIKKEETNKFKVLFADLAPYQKKKQIRGIYKLVRHWALVMLFTYTLKPYVKFHKTIFSRTARKSKRINEQTNPL